MKVSAILVKVRERLDKVSEKLFTVKVSLVKVRHIAYHKIRSEAVRQTLRRFLCGLEEALI